MPEHVVHLQDSSGYWRAPRVADVQYSRDEIGCATAQFTLLDPSGVDLAPDREVRITDRSGVNLWTGNAAVPGRDQVGRSMVASQVSCAGNVADVNRRSVRGAYRATGSGVTLYSLSGGVAATDPPTVRASQVVTDVVRRRLRTIVDLDLCDIGTTSTLLDKVEYDVAATLDLLTDMLKADDVVLRWSPRDEDGLAVLEYGPWPSTPRYLVPAHDGVVVSEPGGDSDLCNRVTVTWTDVAGKAQATTRSASVIDYPDTAYLPTGGREAEPLDLGSELGSASNAASAAARYLAQVAVLPDTLSVSIAPSVSVVDLAGSVVIPAWRMRAGEVVHVTSVGRSLRCTEVSVDGAVTRLSLGRARLSTDQILARLRRVVAKK